MNNTDFDIEKEVIKDRLEDFIVMETRGQHNSPSSHMYACLLCGSGTHRSSTSDGALHVTGRVWHCGACDRGGDIYTYKGFRMNLNPKDPEDFKMIHETLKKELGIAGQSSPGRSVPEKKPVQKQTVQVVQTLDLKRMSLIEKYQSALSGSEGEKYWKDRGLNDDTIRIFRLGYNPTKKAVSIAYPNTDYFVERFIQKSTSDKNKYDNPSGTTAPMFVAKTSPKLRYFLTEGQIDAMSLYQAGAKNVIACHYQNKLGEWLEAQEDVEGVVIVADREKDKEDGTNSGRQLAETMKNKLAEYGVASVIVYPPEPFKDSNDVLKSNPELLRVLVGEWKRTLDDFLRRSLNEYMKTSSRSVVNLFRNVEQINTPAISTGFQMLDNVLDGGLYEGLYIFGAVSSMGKTSMMLQIADQIASSGQDVVYISLEMSSQELVAKCLSRRTYNLAIDKRHAKTVRDLTSAKRRAIFTDEEKSLIDRSIDSYEKEVSDRLFIFEGVGDIGVKEIRGIVERHIRITGRTPVVFIDYLQIIAPFDVRASDKQNTDKSVLELKRLSRDLKVVVFAVSSFNRDNYNKEASLEAFKESGAIEYGSDVLMALEIQWNVYTTDQRKGKAVIDFVKTQPSGFYQITVLKNRNFRTNVSARFNYRKAFNLFEEDRRPEQDKRDEVEKVVNPFELDADEDGFIQIPT